MQHLPMPIRILSYFFVTIRQVYFYIREASEFTGLGAAANRGGGLDDPRRGREPMWTTHEGGRKNLDNPLGGAKNFGQPVRGGRKILDNPLGGATNFGLGQYFFKFLKPDFLCFLGVLGTFNFWVKFFGRLIRGAMSNFWCNYAITAIMP